MYRAQISSVRVCQSHLMSSDKHIHSCNQTLSKTESICISPGWSLRPRSGRSPPPPKKWHLSRDREKVREQLGGALRWARTWHEWGAETNPLVISGGQSPSTGVTRARRCQEGQFWEPEAGIQTHIHSHQPRTHPASRSDAPARLVRSQTASCKFVYSAQPSPLLVDIHTQESGCFTLANRFIFLKHCILR